MKNKKRKICVVTGTRAEYGLLRPCLYAIQKKKNLELQLVVTGMHLLRDFGNTLDYILKDGFVASVVASTASTEDSSFDMAKSIGVGIVEMTKVFKKLKPDIVLILGDRIEALAAAIAASYSGIIVAHIHGGDSAEAGLDENSRHAITKIAHIHFPATKKSAKRIIKMGEEKSKIFISGAPGLDDILAKEFTTKAEVARAFKLDLSKPIMIVLQHPVTTEIKDASKQIKETLEAVADLQFQTVIIYPNSDAGGRSMIKIIEKYKRTFPWFQTYKSVPRGDYLGLLNVASVLVGNSSSGIIESPPFNLPVVDIGDRQKGRERSSNIIHVGYNRQEIVSAVKRSLADSFQKRVKKSVSPYTKRGAGKKIAEILSTTNLNQKLLKKKITY